MMGFKGSIFTFLALMCLKLSTCQLHRIFFGPPFDYTMPNMASDTPEAMRANTAIFKNTKKTTLCAYGLWALYNETNFGQGKETTTKVWTIRGLPGILCAPLPSYPDLKQVSSAQFLGDPDYSKDGLVIFSEPNFLGPKTDVLAFPPPANSPAFPIRLGSIAITANKGVWMLCPDKDCLNVNDNVCIDMTDLSKGTYYLNKDVQKDKSAKWPLYVRTVKDGGNQDSCNGVTSRIALSKVDVGLRSAQGLLVERL